MESKIIIGTNVLTAIDSSVYSNHINFYCQLARNRDIKIIHCAPGRMAIDRMRNITAKVALENDCTHILFIDDDVLVQPGTVESLLDTDLDIVMAHTYIRGYPYHPMCFKRKDTKEGMYSIDYFDDILDVAKREEKAVIPCEAIGFSCCLIKTWLFKELEEPYFVTTPNSTEDVYFCIRCRNDIQGTETSPGVFEGKQVKIGVDLRVPTGHLLDREPVSIFTVDALKILDESLKRINKPNPEHENRANDYLKEIEELTSADAPQAVIQ